MTEELTIEEIAQSRQAIGHYLQTLRKRKGYTKYYMIKGHKLNMTQLNNIESGDNPYTIDTLFRYCDRLGAGVQVFEEKRV